MYSMSNLVKEIAEITDHLIKRGISLQPDWVTQKILSEHKKIKGDDSDFYTCVSKETIRDQVRKRINKFKITPKQDSEIDKQFILPGFERLQLAYLIEINGEQIAVPLHIMTSAQRKAKAAELRAMGAGCYQHADELDRYDEEHPNELAA